MYKGLPESSFGLTRNSRFFFKFFEFLPLPTREEAIVRIHLYLLSSSGGKVLSSLIYLKNLQSSQEIRYHFEKDGLMAFCYDKINLSDLSIIFTY